MSSNTINPKIAVKDAEFMYRVVQHMDGRPNVNWEGLAATLNYKSGAVASTRFNQIKRKMEAPTNSNGSGSNDSGVKNTTSVKTSGKPKSSKVTKVQTGKPRKSRKALAAQTSKENNKEEAKNDLMAEVKRGIIEDVAAAELENIKDDDSITDFDMLEKEDFLNCDSEQKHEGFDCDEEEYLIVMSGDEDGDADDEQVQFPP